jgi:hypothetical protein
MSRIGLDVGRTNTDAVVVLGREVPAVVGPAAFGFDEVDYRPRAPG